MVYSIVYMLFNTRNVLFRTFVPFLRLAWRSGVELRPDKYVL
jgi:hypothetical protein